MQIFKNLNKILPKYDSRSKDYSYAIYGQVGGFYEEYNTDRPELLDDIQPSGDVKCTLYGITDVAEDKEGKEYDMDELASRIVIGKYGTDPRAVIKEVIKNGLFPIGGKEREKIFNSFWQAHTGRYDAFDNVRSALILSKYPILVWGEWHYNWLGGIVEKGTGFSNYHLTDAEGWKWARLEESVIDGEVVLCIEAWVGRKYYFKREVFNWWAKTYGFDTAVLSTIEIDARRKKTLLETMRDALVNLVILYKQLIAQQSEQVKKKTL